MKKKQKTTTDAVQILKGSIAKDKRLKNFVIDARVNAEISQMIYKARGEAKLSQSQLAKLVGTTQSVISRLEDADYEGHSLHMLQRIAQALNRKLKLSFLDQAA